MNVKFHLAEYNKIVQEQRFEIEELKKKIDELEAAQLGNLSSLYFLERVFLPISFHFSSHFSYVPVSLFF